MRATGVAVLAGVLLIAGCGGDDDPPPLPPVTAPVTTSAVASPSVSAFPETRSGAAAFGRQFFAAVNLAYREKNPSVLTPYFASGCEACERYTSTIQDLASGESTVEGSDLTVLGAESPPAENGQQPVTLTVSSTGSVFRDRSGNVTDREPSGEAQIELRLIRSGSGWVIKRIINVSFKPT